ncbi:hypothetical protein EV207_12253 [Scopulibacillus darangshiensis]|uniref:Uncharacterized protein n=1 Tax=Scopulibacillus darangshiensis TaxID=442528 RepID=A0A4R2NSS4_9BACL|nr:hypothetical protein [Scopulibacillus darangshiensis]TCP24950.1 hypothetical protein EV207_12253 [Scopulibacillus darangshiensis]
MKTSSLIMSYLQQHPGSGYKQILKHCRNNMAYEQHDHHLFKSHIASNLRKLRKKNKAINKGNVWYLNEKASS